MTPLTPSPESHDPPDSSAAGASSQAEGTGKTEDRQAGPSAGHDAGPGSNTNATDQPEGRPKRRRMPGWLTRWLPAPADEEAGTDHAPVLDDADYPRDALARHPVRIGFGLAVGVGIAVLTWLALAELSQLLMWIAVALFIAMGLDPIVRFFEHRGAHRWMGVMAVTLMVLGVVGAFLALLIPALIDQITQLLQRAPDILRGLSNNPLVLRLDEQFHLLDRLNQQARDMLQDPEAVGGFYTGVLNAGNLVGEFFFGALIVIVLAIYFLFSLPHIKLFLYSLAPRSRRQRVAGLTEGITRSVGNYVMGQGVVAGLNAICAFILMSAVGIPYAVLLALCVAVLAFIPLVGGVLAGTLMVLVALFSISWQPTLIFAILYIAYLQVEAYFISPRVMSKAVRVPGSVVVIAVVAGGSLLGVAGALMAIPIAAAGITLVNEVFVRRQNER